MLQELPQYSTTSNSMLGVPSLGALVAPPVLSAFLFIHILP